MSIRLGELFSCTEQGGAFVAEAADGRLLHIDEVPSGLACNCGCPGCGRRMVAKKGDVQAHHFAHHAQQDGRACVSAGETALHKLAKKILDERLEIALPAQRRVTIGK
jgi:competence CoiA-like predicted nuclease